MLDQVSNASSIQTSVVTPRQISFRQNSFSLIEFMVALTIGLILMTGLVTLFVNNSRTRVELEKTGQQIESGRFATELLTEDLRMAGYYGELNPNTGNAATPGSLPDPCDVTTAGITAALALPIQGIHNVSSGTKPSCLSDVKPNTDVLVVRRASSCTMVRGASSWTAASGCDAMDTTKYTYFQTALCNITSGQYVIDTDTTKFTLTKRDCTTPADLRAYFTRIYFVANNNNAGDAIPTLKMVELGPLAFTATPVPMVVGIDQLQIQYGVAASTSVETPGTYTSDPGTTANWRNITSVKLGILARNTAATNGFSSTKTYQLGATTYGPYGWSE